MQQTNSMRHRRHTLVATATLLLTLLTYSSANATTLLCYSSEDLMPQGFPPIEFRFDGAGNFEYGINRTKMNGSLTETKIYFLADKPEPSGWIIDRMTGDWFVFGPTPGRTEPSKALIGRCKSAEDRKF